MEIPKIIHYCWFGQNKLPDTAIKCIDSWKKYLPDYEIKEWNENNFDVNSIPYTAQAYKAKKYAFVSDYARFKILYDHGGLYFDTDVELIRPLKDIIADGPFMGCERDANEVNDISLLGINPGLGLGAFRGMDFYREILDKYESINFLNNDGTPNTLETVVTIVTKILIDHGLKLTPNIQDCTGIKIYPKEYFAPKDVISKRLNITNNTRSIHHYDASWAEWYDRAAGERGPKLKKLLGATMGQNLNVCIYLIQKYGFIGVINKILRIK